MNTAQLESILDSITCRSIGIIGDFCLDSYLIIDSSVSELSVETGLPTRPVRKRHFSLGGASNVANNLADMGVGNISVFGIRGNDGEGDILIRLLEDKRIDTGGLLIQKENWATHVFTKLYDGERELERIDYGNFNILADETMEELLAALEKELSSLDILIVNQQVYRGVQTAAFRKRLNELLQKTGSTSAVTDSRSYADDFDATMRKINDVEGARICGMKIPATEHVGFQEADNIAEQLYSRWGKPVFLTRGGYGSLVRDDEGLKEVPALQILSRIDTVGAGDSMLAGIAAALSTGAAPEQAAEFGTLAAGVTIRKLKVTGTASAGEIRVLHREGSFNYNPELAENPGLARYYNETSIEVITPRLLPVQLKYAIFDHDGTVSTLRQGWETIMEPVMIRSVLGSGPVKADEQLLEKVTLAVRSYIDRTTGVQTLVQMHGLAELVRDFGIVPKEDILAPEEYKEIYNTELLGMVDRRVAQFRSGELTLEEVTMTNVLPFLRELRKHGVVLCLASGTDEEDVRREAEILGYADLFDGGIYGAVGDIKVEPKKMVMNRILEELGGEVASLATFGDGPVELRESRKRGALAVGVASDEIKRSGLNEAKRKRLILAGADIIIPDFSCAETLLEVLFKE